MPHYLGDEHLQIYNASRLGNESPNKSLVYVEQYYNQMVCILKKKKKKRERKAALGGACLLRCFLIHVF